MQSVSPQYNFTAIQEGEFTKFVYKKTPLSYKALGPMCLNAILPAGFLTYLFRPQTATSVIITFIVSLIASSALIIAIINAFRRSGEFSISKTKLVANDKSYDLDHISSFVIKDPNGGYIENVVTVHTSHNPFSFGSNVGKMQNEFQNIGRIGRAALKQHFRNVGYKIVIRYASKEIAIASGLGKIEAESLFDKISEVAGYTKK